MTPEAQEALKCFVLTTVSQKVSLDHVCTPIHHTNQNGSANSCKYHHRNLLCISSTLCSKNVLKLMILCFNFNFDTPFLHSIVKQSDLSCIWQKAHLHSSVPAAFSLCFGFDFRLTMAMRLAGYQSSGRSLYSSSTLILGSTLIHKSCYRPPLMPFIHLW